MHAPVRPAPCGEILAKGARHVVSSLVPLFVDSHLKAAMHAEGIRCHQPPSDAIRLDQMHTGALRWQPVYLRLASLGMHGGTDLRGTRALVAIRVATIPLEDPLVAVEHEHVAAVHRVSMHVHLCQQYIVHLWVKGLWVEGLVAIRWQSGGIR